MSMIKKMSKTQWIGLSLAISILFIEMLLYSLLIPIIPYFNGLFHPSSTMMGILFSSYAAALLLATPWFGWLSDRIGRKLPIILGLAGLGIATCLFAFAGNMAMLIAARFVQGAAAAAAWTAVLAMLADLFPGKSRGAAMGIALTGISTGSMLGAPIGGWLFEAGGFRAPFFCAAALIAAVIVISVLFLKESMSAKTEAKAGGGMIPLLRNRSVLLIACVVLLAEITLTLLEPILPGYITERLTVTPLGIGLMFGAMTLAYGLIAPFSGALATRFNPYVIMLSGLTGLAVAMPLLVASDSIVLELAGMILVGALVGFTLSPTLPTLGGIVDQGGDSGEYGTAYALFNMFHAVGMIIGPLVGGVLTDLLTVPAAVVAVSVVIVSCALMLFGVLKTMNKRKWSAVGKENGMQG
ncbi:MFS transporter [Paenibacillus doosanensis]|uniref:Bacillibactin exporter n=1 Tax=Paenibacillus konkukensis TaxID=2020716 RepID=A0ABY4RGZ2_9BACL|nr:MULTISPECIES: MFS transporter [Paenibacillus]MCS7461972.1 MFS transporter [Paenibacillus doosanensis]UQZ81483.1 Bacillibactin exporter [Paenibacillus konkukensis]